MNSMADEDISVVVCSFGIMDALTMLNKSKYDVLVTN